MHQQLPELAMIPAHRMRLLFISIDEPSSHTMKDNTICTTYRCGDDVSTIYASLPVRQMQPGYRPTKLGYYPTYCGMSPTQRGFYLWWLRDTSLAAPIGYVFVYYYGLERHLIAGDFESAVDEILALRRHHTWGYSTSALFYACLLRNRPDKLQTILTTLGPAAFSGLENSSLVVMHRFGLELCSHAILGAASWQSELRPWLLPYDHTVIEEAIRETLRKRFGRESYPLAARFSLHNLKVGGGYPVLANSSLSHDIRAPRLPDLARHPPFLEEIAAIIQEACRTVQPGRERNRRS
jgi:hypothetical protein